MERREEGREGKEAERDKGRKKEARVLRTEHAGG